MLSISNAVKSELTKPQTAHLWGQPHRIEPVLINKHLGNGDLLLGLSPLNTRPNYYLIRIDSSWLDKENTDIIYDHLEDIYEAIEDECGRKYFTDDNDEEQTAEWPSLDLDCGCSWWDETETVTKPKGKKK